MGDSGQEQKKMQVFKCVLCGHYGDSDVGRFGNSWNIDELDVSKLFNNFRQVCIH
jgi:hypothetical protein